MAGPYYTNNKFDEVDVIAASDLEAIETGFLNVDQDKANKAVPATTNSIALLGADGDLVDSERFIPSGELVTTDEEQTLLEKTLTLPKINDTSEDHQYIVNVSELAANRNITLPLLTGDDEFVFKSHIQTLTNKTLSSPLLVTPQIRDNSNTYSYIFSTSELAVDRTVTLPLLTGNDTFVFADHAATLSNKILSTPILTTPQINDSGADHKYLISPSNLSADRTITLPLLTGNDTLVFQTHTQTLTNKTINGGSISGTISGNATLSGNITFTGNLTGIPAKIYATSNVGITGSSLVFGSVSGSRNLAIMGGVGISSGSNNFVYNADGDDVTGDHNLCLMSGSAASLTSGSSNVFIGRQTGVDVTDQDDNVLVGTFAGSNIASDKNVCLGYRAGYRVASETGNGSICIGTEAAGNISGTTSTTRTDSIAIGYRALYAVNNGSDNIAIGPSAGLAVTNGSNNVLIGKNAGSVIAAGGTNTCIGNDAGSAGTVSGNNTLIGNGAQVSGASNEVVLGNSSVSVLRCQQSSISALSDRRDKKNIEALNAGIDFINNLLPVRFTWNMRDGGIVDVEDTGFIAQELKSAQDHLGINIPGLVNEANPDRIEAAYGKLLPVIVRAIQELSEQIQELKTR